MASEEMDSIYLVPIPHHYPKGGLPAAVRSARRVFEHRRECQHWHHLFSVLKLPRKPQLRCERPAEFLQPGKVSRWQQGIAVYGPLDHCWS